VAIVNEKLMITIEFEGCYFIRMRSSLFWVTGRAVEVTLKKPRFLRCF